VKTFEHLLEDAGIRRMFDVFDGDGEETRIAGGAVRDALIGIMPEEVDFATTALPDDVMRRAAAAHLKTIPTGVTHGTVTVIVDGRPFEITTLRRDVETDGRHAVVAFGRDWVEDAMRRDFTINGLFLDRAGKVHDFVGGEADLAACRVRFIGDARTRIREDFLRILRFFRFFARYSEGAPDEEALSAAISERHGLEHLSRERIRAELVKFLTARRAPEAAEIMANAGLLGMVLGGVARPVRLRRLADIEAASGHAPDAILRLGALALFIEDDSERLRGRLRLSNEETARMRAMAGRPVVTSLLSEAERKAALYRARPEVFRDRVFLAWADSGAAADDREWRDLLAFPERWTAPHFPVTGRDLAAIGIEPGPDMGKKLRALEEWWIAAGFPEGKDWLKQELGKS
jgi:poly(A) polymerase